MLLGFGCPLFASNLCRPLWTGFLFCYKLDITAFADPYKTCCQLSSPGIKMHRPLPTGFLYPCELDTSPAFCIRYVRRHVLKTYQPASFGGGGVLGYSRYVNVQSRACRCGVRNLDLKSSAGSVTNKCNRDWNVPFIVKSHWRIQGALGVRPPAPKIFFYIMQFSSNFMGNPPF